MPIRVTLGIYSAELDPSWTLSSKQAAQLEARIAELTTRSLNSPAGKWGPLGYGGFTNEVIVKDGAKDGARSYLVHEGLVDAIGEYARVDPDRWLERFLLESMPTRLTRELRLIDRIRKEIDKPPHKVWPPLNQTPVGCPANVGSLAPNYDPASWNAPSTQPSHNCYAYAANVMPGHYCYVALGPGCMPKIVSSQTDCT